MARDYYDVLGVARNAGEQDIKNAYRKLARQYHPDRNPGDKEAETKFRELQQAYDVLSDTQKRGQYDRFGADFEQAAAGARGGPGGGFNFQWGGPGGATYGNVDPEQFQSVFEELFGRGAGGFGQQAGGRGRGRRRAPPPEDVEHEMEVDFMTAARGGSVELQIQHENGAPERLKVDIPAGIADGGRLRLKGQGERGGDLYVRVRIRPHPLFRREGQDLLVAMPITIAEAVLGGKVDVPTIDGTITLTVPPGTSSGQRLRLRGKGLATPGKSDRGDQYVEVKIVVPREPDARSRELIEEFSRRNPQNPRA